MTEVKVNKTKNNLIGDLVPLTTLSKMKTRFPKRNKSQKGNQIVRSLIHNRNQVHSLKVELEVRVGKHQNQKTRLSR